MPPNSNIAEYESRGHEYGVIHWRSREAGPLKTQLAQSLNINDETLLTLLKLGAVYSVNGRMSDWQELEKVSPAQTYLRLHTKPRRFQVPASLRSRIVFSHPDFIVVNKPQGIPCHATVDNRQENLITALAQEMAEPLYITHRLDVGTEGLLLLAKTKNFQSFFNQEIKEGRVRKYYQTKIEGCPVWEIDQIFTHWMKPSPRAPKELSSMAEAGWPECRLKIMSCKPDLSKNTTEVRLELLTGRTHQIRAQLSHLGHPLCDDIMYGAAAGETNSPKNLFLRSQSLSFHFADNDWLFEL